MAKQKVTFRCQLDSDVSLVQSSGSDRLIFRAARGSFGGGDEEPDEERLKEFIGRLLRMKHLVPFEHCSMTFEIQAPIFVFRQLFRYRTASISERSMRYCEALPVFYLPESTANNVSLYEYGYNHAWGAYTRLLKAGETKEKARAVLPTGVFSRCLFTIDLRNFLHICEQRLQKDAQEETSFIVKRMFLLARDVFPVTMGVFQW